MNAIILTNAPGIFWRPGLNVDAMQVLDYDLSRKDFDDLYDKRARRSIALVYDNSNPNINFKTRGVLAEVLVVEFNRHAAPGEVLEDFFGKETFPTDADLMAYYNRYHFTNVVLRYLGKEYSYSLREAMLARERKLFKSLR